ncbi:hypothetical protein GZH82_12255 [Staphylococcus ursi]|uniref:hypothetical protein n=1 Tax=Staphylococcus sp. MI 10-1553 TaxID=1912064 RepID=UPI001397C5B0|nr:hypothetical protein [Staphylococcus sp. MI 10-1553]QHW38056.1 hypothetical protein GZH82_12255 [Staphylococcus sp. MI 10-1553]
MTITKSRTLTYNGEEVYARTHKDVVDGLLNATATSDGLMSAADKRKLDGLNQQSGTQNLSVATSTTNGLMSAADKQKLDRLNTDSVDYRAVSGGSGSSVSGSSGSQILNRNIDVWPNATQRVTLNKPVSDCKTGIVLVWRLDTSDNLYHYQHIPKYHVATHSAAHIAEAIPTMANEICIKQVIVLNTSVVGVSENNNASYKTNKIRLCEILEY